MAVDPGVEGGLRFFEQNNVAIAGLVGGAFGEVARNGVERCGHGDQDLLLVERRVRPGLRPGVAEMFQVAPRCFDGRDFAHAFHV